MNNRQSKYKTLADYLANSGQEQIVLTFDQIEKILGFRLSRSNREYRANWANNSMEALSRGWLPVGYESHDVDMRNGIVHFQRVSPIKAKVPETAENRKPHRISQTHATNGIIITNTLIDDAHRKVEASYDYGRENALITECFKKFPLNNDVIVVAMKVGLIDITNSTHLSQHKAKITAVEIAECIVKVKDIDKRIKEGDPEVVNEIAKSNGKINLFSFASKYCCYHNKNLYGNDDYSILDTVLKEALPKYFPDVTQSQIQKWQNTYNYKAYNDYISKKLDELKIDTPFRRRKFDHYIWLNNRKKEKGTKEM